MFLEVNVHSARLGWTVQPLTFLSCGETTHIPAWTGGFDINTALGEGDHNQQFFPSVVGDLWSTLIVPLTWKFRVSDVSLLTSLPIVPLRHVNHGKLRKGLIKFLDQALYGITSFTKTLTLHFPQYNSSLRSKRQRLMALCSVLVPDTTGLFGLCCLCQQTPKEQDIERQEIPHRLWNLRSTAVS